MATVEERFFSKVDKKKKNECWEWLGAKTKTGYGCFWPERRTTVTAHRFMYEIWYETEVLSINDVHHICYNKSCVNPLHLQELTKQKNTADAFDRIKECINGHLKIPENLYYKANGTKDCKVCRRTYRQRKRQINVS